MRNINESRKYVQTIFDISGTLRFQCLIYQELTENML